MKGTFGLGAITFYHVTDIINIVSGDNVLFLDIHKSWLPFDPKRKGERLASMFGNFIQKEVLKKYPGNIYEEIYVCRPILSVCEIFTAVGL